MFRHDGQPRLAPPRQFIDDLDTLPFPAWDLLEGFPARYHPSVFKYRRLPSTHLVTSRGCPSRCTFCDTSVFGRAIRFHGAEYVLDMLTLLYNSHGIRDFIFEDDQFLLDRPRLEAICEGILRRGLRISWSCNGRVNSIRDATLPALVRRAGCWQINFGIESGDQTILNAMRKGITLPKVEEAIRLVHQAGIQTRGYFVLGFPEDTPATVQRSIRFACRLPLDDVSVFMLTPFPGSEIYRRQNQEHYLTDSFEKMNVLNVIATPRQLTDEQLRSAQRAFLRAFYLRPRALPGLVAALWRIAPQSGQLLRELLERA